MGHDTTTVVLVVLSGSSAVHWSQESHQLTILLMQYSCLCVVHQIKHKKGRSFPGEISTTYNLGETLSTKVMFSAAIQYVRLIRNK